MGAALSRGIKMGGEMKVNKVLILLTGLRKSVQRSDSEPVLIDFSSL